MGQSLEKDYQISEDKKASLKKKWKASKKDQIKSELKERLNLVWVDQKNSLKGNSHYCRALKKNKK